MADSHETITIDGDETLRRTMRAAESDLAEMDQEDNARMVAQRAAGKAPKVSGTLARSVYAKDLGKGEAAVLSDLIYAPVIHYGWAAHHITPQPFLTEALADSARLVEANSERKAQAALAKVRGA